MKGKLHKTEQGWVVIYDQRTWQDPSAEDGVLPLHPDSMTELSIRSDKKLEDRIGQEIDFEIVTLEIDVTPCGNHIIYADYAKLIKHSVYANEMIDHIGKVNEMVEDDVWKAGLEDELNKLPYTKHLDDGQYNDGVLTGFEFGATWGYNKAKETLYTEEQVREAIDMARELSGYASYEFKENEIIQSLKQPKQ